MKKLLFFLSLTTLLTACTVNIDSPDDQPQEDQQVLDQPEQDMNLAVESYTESPYRILRVIPYPDEPYLFSLVVATDRASGDQNDTQCGGLYSMPTCYFFIESGNHVDSPEPHFLAKYGRDLDDSFNSLDFDSITFIDQNTIEFDAIFGDGGYFVSNHVQLDLLTGEFTLLETVEETMQ